MTARILRILWYALVTYLCTIMCGILLYMDYLAYSAMNEVGYMRYFQISLVVVVGFIEVSLSILMCWVGFKAIK